MNPGSAGNGTLDFSARDGYKHCQSRFLCLQQLRTVVWSCDGCLKSGSPSLMIVLNPPSPDLLFQSWCGVTVPPDIAVLLQYFVKGSGGFQASVDLLGGQDISGDFTQGDLLPRRMCWKRLLCLPCWGARLPPAQFSSSACLLPGSTALTNFALLYYDLNWYVLKKFETERHLDGGEIRK